MSESECRKICYYEVRIETSCDGRGPSEVAARIASRSEAEIFAVSDAGRGVYGQPGKVRLVDIEIFDTAEAAEAAGATSAETIKKQALAKLTDAEKAALGL